MLGKGLESLIPNKNNNEENRPKYQDLTADKRGVEAVFQIEVDKIKPNPHQPRKFFDETSLQELASSIREMGIIQPLIISKIETVTNSGTDVAYQLVAGERRLKAAKLIGLERVPAIVRVISQEKEKLEMAIVENMQRADLNPIESARSCAKLAEEFGLTQREIAARLGKSRETISNLMRLLNLPTQMQEAIANNKLSESQGRLLLTLNDQIQQQKLFDEIVNNNVSVRDLRSKISRLNNPSSNIAATTVSSVDPQLSFWADKLQERLGTKITFQKNGSNGKLIINFYSDEELRAIIEKFGQLFK